MRLWSVVDKVANEMRHENMFSSSKLIVEQNSGGSDDAIIKWTKVGRKVAGGEEFPSKQRAHMCTESHQRSPRLLSAISLWIINFKAQSGSTYTLEAANTFWPRWRSTGRSERSREWKSFIMRTTTYEALSLKAMSKHSGEDELCILLEASSHESLSAEVFRTNLWRNRVSFEENFKFIFSSWCEVILWQLRSRRG